MDQKMIKQVVDIVESTVDDEEELIKENTLRKGKFLMVGYLIGPLSDNCNLVCIRESSLL